MKSIGAGRDDGADLRGRSLHDALRADDAKHVAPLQHDAARDGNLLIAATQRSQVETARPILLRGLAEAGTGKLAIDEEDVGQRERDVEELLVLDLLAARPDQLDDDLARPGERDHVARLKARTGLRFDDAVGAAQPVDEQPVLRRARLGRGGAQSHERRALGQSIGAQLEFAPSGRDPRLGASHSQRLLEFERLGLQVELEQGRDNDRAEEDHAGIAEDVSYRVRHRDVSHKPCAVRLRYGQAVDGVGRRPHRGAVGERT